VLAHDEAALRSGPGTGLVGGVSSTLWGGAGGAGAGAGGGDEQAANKAATNDASKDASKVASHEAPEIPCRRRRSNERFMSLKNGENGQQVSLE